MISLENAKLDPRKSDSVVSASICSTQLKKLGRIVHDSKIKIPQNTEELENILQFASQLSSTQRHLISSLLNLPTPTNAFINSLGYEEELEPNSETLAEEPWSDEEDEEDDDDRSFIDSTFSKS